MRNWRFLTAQQIVRGDWMMLPEHAINSGEQLDLLLNPNQDFAALSQSIIELNGPLPQTFASVNEGEGDGYSDMPEGSIATFKITGTYLKHDTMCSYGNETVGNAMVAAANNKNIAGCLFHTDSGGGAVNAIAPILEGIQAFKSAGKPVLGLADAAYSAAYYAISACDYIMADNNLSAGFGSIGVMATLVDIRGKIEKEGGKIHTIYAPESEEKNKAFELALEGKYELIQQEHLSPLAVAFQNAVKTNRSGKLKLDEGNLVLKGKTYNAQQSLSMGLIDAIGNRQKAIEHLFDMVQTFKFLNS